MLISEAWIVKYVIIISIKRMFQLTSSRDINNSVLTWYCWSFTIVHNVLLPKKNSCDTSVLRESLRSLSINFWFVVQVVYPSIDLDLSAFFRELLYGCQKCFGQRSLLKDDDLNAYRTRLFHSTKERLLCLNGIAGDFKNSRRFSELFTAQRRYLVNCLRR